MNRYFLISIIVFFASIWYYLIQKPESSQYYIEEKKFSCDTTQIPNYTVFDIANAINGKINIDNNLSKVIVYITDNKGYETLFLYNKADNNFQELRDSTSSIPSLSTADSITLNALIDPSPKLYDRWCPVIIPYRVEFISKRAQLFDNLPSQLPGYDFKILSDFRNAEKQAKLLSAGWSATPVSAHQFGLATDIAIKRNGRYLKGFTFYKIMGQMAIDQGLIWGGNFVGFIDPGHIQLFENSAKLLSEIPELRFEFAPFRNYYLQRIEKMEKEGKEELVEDTKELIQKMDLLNSEKLCACNESSFSIVNTTPPQSAKLSAINYHPDNDFLIYLDENSKKITLIQPAQDSRAMQLGTWK